MCLIQFESRSVIYIQAEKENIEARFLTQLRQKNAELQERDVDLQQKNLDLQRNFVELQQMKTELQRKDDIILQKSSPSHKELVQIRVKLLGSSCM